MFCSFGNFMYFVQNALDLFMILIFMYLIFDMFSIIW